MGVSVWYLLAVDGDDHVLDGQGLEEVQHVGPVELGRAGQPTPHHVLGVAVAVDVGSVCSCSLGLCAKS